MITIPTPEVTTAPSTQNIDRGLEAALANKFKNYVPQEPAQEEPKVEAKVEEPPKQEQKEVTIELKKDKQPKEVKQESKPVDEEKPLPNPDSLEESPQGKGQAAWNALKNNYKRSHKLIETKDQEISKLKASLAEKTNLTQKETETLKSEIQELAKYRAMVDIQADPEFVSKFDQPIEKAIGSIKQMIMDLNVDKSIVDAIDFTNPKLLEQITSGVAQHADKFTARKIDEKIEKLLSLTDQRNETLSEHKVKYKEVLEAKKKEAYTKDAEGEGRMIKHLDAIAVAKDKNGGSMFPFLNKLESKENATQLEIDQISNHNNMVDLMGQKIKSVLKMSTPEEKAEVAVAAVASHYLSAQLKAATAKILSLQQELNKISNVTSETEKTKPAPAQRNGNHPTKVVDALSNYFPNRG